MVAAPLRPRRSVWVLPGGVVGGAWVGVVFALGATVPDALASQSGFGVSGEWGVVIVGATYGALIGAVFGFPAGVLSFGLLAIGWAVRLPRRVQGAAASGFVTACAAAVLLAVIGPDVQAVALIGLAAGAAAGGIAILFAIDASITRRAPERPRIR